MSKKNRKVSTRFVKNQFNLVGMVLLLYIIIVLLLPKVLKSYFDICMPEYHGNDYVRIGILYTFILIGTFIPFFILKQSTNIKLKDFWRKCNISFYDIFVHTIVFSAMGTAIMFVTSILNSYFYVGSGMVTSIGVAMPIKYLNNPLYFFLFVIATPLLEELAFRGVLLRVLGRYGNAFAMITCSLIYGLLHLTFADSITTFFLSIILIKLTLRYRSVQPAIIIHIIFNLIIYSLEIIPIDYYFVTSIIIFGIYLLAAFFLITHQIRFVKIKRKANDNYVYKLFFSRFSIIISILIMLGYSIVSMFYTF